MPEITVLLPARNAGNYIEEAIQSILNQTCKKFELLIFDDHSTDNTLQIVKHFKDHRIRIFHESAGFINNLNKGIELSKGLYIARMDADDIMHPKRLEIQLQIMRTHLVDLCASWIYIFGEDLEGYVHGNLNGVIQEPLHHLFYSNFIAHPTVMMRKSFLLQHHLRYEDYFLTEDYKLWSEMAKKGGKFYMIPEPLVSYRMSNEQTTARHEQEIQMQTFNVHLEIVEFLRNRDKSS